MIIKRGDFGFIPEENDWLEEVMGSEAPVCYIAHS